MRPRSSGCAPHREAGLGKGSLISFCSHRLAVTSPTSVREASEIDTPACPSLSVKLRALQNRDVRLQEQSLLRGPAMRDAGDSKAYILLHTLPFLYVLGTASGMCADSNSCCAQLRIARLSVRAVSVG